MFVILDPSKSFRQRIGDLDVDCYFPKEAEYTGFKETVN